jgi:hypothetical protein
MNTIKKTLLAVLLTLSLSAQPVNAIDKNTHGIIMAYSFWFATTTMIARLNIPQKILPQKW